MSTDNLVSFGPTSDEETVVHDEHDEQIEAAEISTHNIVQSSSAAAHNEQILVPSLGVGNEKGWTNSLHTLKRWSNGCVLLAGGCSIMKMCASDYLVLKRWSKRHVKRGGDDSAMASDDLAKVAPPSFAFPSKV
ncbi:hypothetical protein V6N11_031238 [Hibiscus sabdariffa]|uniref:Uncharacterized protein n=1 Tax=Hibiscus sabdariffa TaxID=183260 RepID=A0ABR2A006_9ROSI